ncbi:unnamed protein product, partial [Allacma fusca]
MQFSNFIVCAIFVAIFVIAITPSDTFAKRPWIRPRLCGGKRCNSSGE